MRRKKLQIVLILAAIVLLIPVVYILALIAKTPNEAKIDIEHYITETIRGHKIPWYVEIDSSPDVNWLGGYYKKEDFLGFPKLIVAECYDFASFVFLSRDWDCRARFQENKEIYVQGIWTPYK